ncbi:MAG: hypothetical protein IH940_07205, partial [Acidobacteria bacterium]|nr:hypothetical protein [Acidobacteriota bacterium]
MLFRRALLALFVVSVGLTAVGATTAHACECSNTSRSFDDQAGDIAFIGTLVEITDGAWQFEIEHWLTEPR